ncbi:MAG: hypothetical protein H6510_09010 [Acidobacteria bacterium]|nr:hypothetical protein [Acidobacteriota bacterium]MCB9397943.1 hypothetical protein [Acidobacteriota bacterium]
MPTRKPELTINQLKDHLLHYFFNDLTQDNRLVGLELEVTPIQTDAQGNPKTVPLVTDDKMGVVDLFRSQEAEHHWYDYAPSPDGAWRFVDQLGGQITFEPGGQVEYSSATRERLYDVVVDVATALERIQKILAGHQNTQLYFSGLNPFHSVQDVGLQIRKERYINMDRYFEMIGPFGQKMMRLSTSLQVNLDVGYVETARKRWLAANLLAPVLVAGFGNSPFHEGKFTGLKSYRAKIWQNLDPSRTGFQKGFEDCAYQPCPVQQYLNFALDASCMWLPNEQGNMTFDGHFRTFRHWMDCGFHGFYPTLEEFKKHLTTLFPEVRPRGFYEIRSIDGQPRQFWMVPGFLLTHILYNERALDETIALLEPIRCTLTPMMMEAAVQGMAEPDLANLVKQVFKIAMRAAEPIEHPELLKVTEAFLRHFTYRNWSPADELLALNDGKIFSLGQFYDLERIHQDLVGDAFKVPV